MYRQIVEIEIISNTLKGKETFQINFSDELTPHDIPYFIYTPTTFIDVEKSYLMYKHIFNY